MALYLGTQKVKLTMHNAVRRIHLLTTKPTIIGILLRSSDGYILKDSAGVRLIAKEASRNG